MSSHTAMVHARVEQLQAKGGGAVVACNWVSVYHLLGVRSYQLSKLIESPNLIYVAWANKSF